MSGLSTSTRRLLLAALGGAVLSCAVTYLIMHRNVNQSIQSMQRTIATLRSSLERTEAQLQDSRLRLLQHGISDPSDRVKEDRVGSIREGAGVAQEDVPATAAVSSMEILNDLENSSESDSRSYAEKLQELLSDSAPDEAATAESAAIASRFILDKAGDQEGLPDHSLQTLYSSQPNPDLKRVIAQVLSQRGNDALLTSYITETQARLESPQPADRLAALSQLGQLHSTRAVNAIAPFLQDSDPTVRLAALFALRDSGNQQHVSLVENMTRDPDPSVSTLADAVVNSLRNLSSSAHTSYSRADIEGELPPIANP
jgi:hypothetical protein